MPTINLSNQQNTPQTPPLAPPVAPAPSMNNGGWNDSWDNPWGNTPTGQSKRQSPQERVVMIEKVYQDVLGRKPDTRDINYYKYSTLPEEEIRNQLLTGTEHKQLLENGRDYKKVKDRALQAETRVKMLEGQIKDQVDEFRQLTNLLKEKNTHIQQLRERINSALKTHPFTTPDIQRPQTTVVVNNSQATTPRKETFVDKVRNVIQTFS